MTGQKTTTEPHLFGKKARILETGPDLLAFLPVHSLSAGFSFPPGQQRQSPILVRRMHAVSQAIGFARATLSVTRVQVETPAKTKGLSSSRCCFWHVRISWILRIISGCPMNSLRQILVVLYHLYLCTRIHPIIGRGHGHFMFHHFTFCFDNMGVNL